MFKILGIFLVISLSFQHETAAYILVKEDLHSPIIYKVPEISPVWKDHIMDFVAMIDIEKVLDAAMGYLGDPEVLNFVTFVMGDDFKNLIWEFENMAEFKEAFKFLSDKGYDMESAINFVNDALNLPPFDKFNVREKEARGTGLKGLIEDVMATLPIEDFKKLFESKLETSPEIAELFETINSKEFMDIMNKMAKNPKFTEFKTVFEGYGFDFKYLCNLAKDVLGEYYQGVFCEM